uniref:Uncharacterized protein n=1 Tax=Strigamia maritima TaxID=126957 RepID=T1J7D3_STRMM
MNYSGLKLIGILTTVVGFSIICINIYIENDSSVNLTTIPSGSPEEFAIFTPGCKIPKLDPFHPSVLKHIEDYTGINLQCTSVPMVLAIDNKLKINKKHALYNTKIKCHFKTLTRQTESDTVVGEAQPLADHRSTPIIDEFVMAECLNESNGLIYQDFFAFIIDKPAVEERCRKVVRSGNTNEPLSVVLLGLDSVSKNAYIRHLKRVDKLIRKKFNFIELHGYNKLGLNTYPNMIPFHTGKMESEYHFNHKKTDLNVLPMVWKKFARRHYRTLFAEDCHAMASFNYLKKGFVKQPTDYYMRPFSIAVDESEMKKLLTCGCYHGRTEASVVYKWILDLFNRFPNDPLFAYSFLTRLSHDSYNTVAYYDKPMYDFLVAMNNAGHLNRTIVLLFSDHGYRFGDVRTSYVGHLEDKLPYFFFLLPKWFPKMYPDYYANMKLNERRLTTPLDIHATLLDISSDLRRVKAVDPGSRSTSLFTPVSLNRTCSIANIESQFCTCFERQQVSVESESAKAGAKLLIEDINQMISSLANSCAVLQLKQIIEVSAHDVDIDRKQKELYTNYLITFEVSPSKGIFQGIALFNHMTNEYTIEKNIDRLNKYGNQSLCINDPHLRLFCYCSINLDKGNDTDSHKNARVENATSTVFDSNNNTRVENTVPDSNNNNIRVENTVPDSNNNTRVENATSTVSDNNNNIRVKNTVPDSNNNNTRVENTVPDSNNNTRVENTVLDSNNNIRVENQTSIIPDSHNNTRVTVPDSHNNTRVTVPDSHNNTRVTVPDSHNNTRVTVLDSHNNTRVTVLDSHNNTRVTVPDSHNNTRVENATSTVRT